MQQCRLAAAAACANVGGPAGAVRQLPPSELPARCSGALGARPQAAAQNHQKLGKLQLACASCRQARRHAGTRLTHPAQPIGTSMCTGTSTCTHSCTRARACASNTSLQQLHPAPAPEPSLSTVPIRSCTSSGLRATPISPSAVRSSSTSIAPAAAETSGLPGRAAAADAACRAACRAGMLTCTQRRT